MIKINEDDLELLLKSKKEKIERPAFTGVGDIVTGISLVITLCTSEFKNIPVVGTIYFKVAMYIIAIGIIVMGICGLIYGFRSKQTIKNLYDNICELNVDRIHVVNIILLRQNTQSGKYLLIKNKAWNCELFPSYNTSSDSYDVSLEMDRIREYLSRDIGFEVIKLTYLHEMDTHFKNCAGTNTQFRYKFHFYRVELMKPDARMNKKFNYNGKRYVWKSLDQMSRNRNIMKKNSDVVGYVANLENIPYN